MLGRRSPITAPPSDLSSVGDAQEGAGHEDCEPPPRPLPPRKAAGVQWAGRAHRRPLGGASVLALDMPL